MVNVNDTAYSNPFFHLSDAYFLEFLSVEDQKTGIMLLAIPRSSIIMSVRHARCRTPHGQCTGPMNLMSHLMSHLTSTQTLKLVPSSQTPDLLWLATNRVIRNRRKLASFEMLFNVPTPDSIQGSEMQELAPTSHFLHTLLH
jgi:hypothetical protein